jgi:hypothetical protein
MRKGNRTRDRGLSCITDYETVDLPWEFFCSDCREYQWNGSKVTGTRMPAQGQRRLKCNQTSQWRSTTFARLHVYEMPAKRKKTSYINPIVRSRHLEGDTCSWVSVQTYWPTCLCLGEGLRHGCCGNLSY